MRVSRGVGRPRNMANPSTKMKLPAIGEITGNRKSGKYEGFEGHLDPLAPIDQRPAGLMVAIASSWS